MSVPDASAALATADGDDAVTRGSSVLHEWVATVDHKRLGIMYVVSGLVFLVIAGLEASLMRLQLAWPGLHIVPPETFNRLFTMHGTTHGVPGRHPDRVRLRQLPRAADDRRPRPGLPAAERLRLLDLPVRRAAPALQLHRRRRALRRGLGAGGRLVRLRAADRAAPSRRGNATDYWNLAVFVTGVGTIATAINFVATILTMRGPGMTLGRMPIFVWTMLDRLRHDPVHPAAAVGRADHAAPRPLSSAPTSSTPRPAARP